MPLSRIEIEEYGGGWWVADVEVGGLVCRRATVRAEGLRALLDAVWAKYVEFRPDEGGGGDPLTDPAPLEMQLQDGIARIEEHPLAAAYREDALEELRREARALGIEVDLRWREKTLQGYIEMAQK